MAPIELHTIRDNEDETQRKSRKTDIPVIAIGVTFFVSTHLIICLRHGNRRARDERSSGTAGILKDKRRCLLTLLIGDLNISTLHDLLLLALLRQLVGLHRRQSDRAILHRRAREGDAVVVHRHDR